MGARARTFRGTALFAAMALLGGVLGAVAVADVAYAGKIPAAPGGVVARGGDAVGTMTLTWQKPTNVAAGAKLDYLVAIRNDSGAFGAAVVVGTGVPNQTVSVARSCAGVTSCGFRVYARNATGTSVASAIATGTWTRPAAPVGKTTTPGPAVGRFALTWTPPVNTGGKAVTGYLYDVQVNGTGPVLGPFSLGNVSSASVPCSSTLATGGCTYRVYAQNVKGTSLTGGLFFGTWGLPAAPVINSVVGGRAEHSATINWRAGATTGGLANTYTYEVSADAGPWVAGSGPLPASPTIATVPCPGQSVCSYRITATSAKGSSPVSNTMSSGYGVASKVLNLKARVANVNLGSGVPTVSVTWDLPANSGGAPVTGYEARRCDGNCDETSTAWNTATVESLGTTRSWATTCPANLVTCSYEVRSINDVGPGPWGSSARIAPFAPTNAVATTAAPAGSVTVTWSGPAESGLGLAGYRLYYCVTTSGCGNTAHWLNTGLSIPPTATSATHNCGDGVQCQYKVTAVEQTSGASGASSTSATATGSSAAGAPQNLTAASATTIGAVDLDWDPPTSSGTFPITDYVFQRSVNGGPFSADISTGSTTTAYTDTACGASNACTYQVAAVTAAGVGPYSLTATAEGANVPSAPQNLDANPGTSLGAVNITWQAPLDNGGWTVTSYFLERSLDGGTTWPQNWTLGTSPSYTDSTCGQGTSCTYRVSATNARGTGPASNTDTAVGPQLSPPQNLMATTSTNTLGGVVLSWTYPANDGGSAVLGYEFRFKQDSGSFSAWVSTGTGTGTTFTHTCFTDNIDRLCTYEVRAFNAIGTSSSSNQAAAQGLTDHAQPAVTVVNPANGSATNTTTPPLSGAAGTAFGDATTVSVTIKQGTTIIQTFPSLPVTSGTWSTTAAALANGVYTVTVNQSDWAGNIGTATNTFTVDTVAPTQTITGPTAILYSSSGTTYTSSNINLWNVCGTAGFCGTAADTGGSGVANVKVSIQQVATGQYWGGSSFNSASENLITTTGTTGWSLPFAVTNFPAGGSYTVRAVAQDLATNSSSGTSVTFFIDFNPADTVFVSPSGNDGNSGLTTALPKLTINAALQAAQAATPVRSVVAVAAAGGGTSYGAVSMSGGTFGNAKTTKGGFDPSTWLRKAPATTNVSTISAGPTAVLVDAKTGIVFQQINIQGSSSGQPAGTTIYGLRAINGANVTIQRVAVGADSGVAGTTGGNGNGGTSANVNGGVGGNGGENGGVSSSCPGGSGAAGTAGSGGASGRQGGLGGAAVCGGNGNPGQQGFQQMSGQGGAFGTGGPSSGNIGCTNAGNAGGGSGGAAGVTATSGGAAGTTFTAGTTWSGSNGAGGTAGTAGHGGGGGGAGGGHNATFLGGPVCGGFDTGGGGGGGGGGGDGGGAGALGTAGGASFGIYANASTVTIQDSSTVTAGNGGNGGNGGAGGAGGNGSAGGGGGSVGNNQGNNPTGAPDGGAGGGGGGGGGGGAGSGGGGGTGGWAVAAFGTNSSTITGGTSGNLTRGSAGTGGTGGGGAARGTGGTAGPAALGSWSATPNGGAAGGTPSASPSGAGGTGTVGTACKLHVNGTCSIT